MLLPSDLPIVNRYYFIRVQIFQIMYFDIIWFTIYIAPISKNRKLPQSKTNLFSIKTTKQRQSFCHLRKLKLRSFLHKLSVLFNRKPPFFHEQDIRCCLFFAFIKQTILYYNIFNCYILIWTILLYFMIKLSKKVEDNKFY